MEPIPSNFYINSNKSIYYSNKAVKWFVNSLKYKFKSDEWKICRLKYNIYNKEATKYLVIANNILKKDVSN